MRRAPWLAGAPASMARCRSRPPAAAAAPAAPHPPAPPRRGLITGGATVAGLAGFVARHPAAALMPRRVMPRTGWPLPALIFGGDDQGAAVGDRRALLQVAVTRRGANAVQVDGDELFARREWGSTVWARRPVDRDWEYHTLSRLLASGAIARSELLVTARLSVGPSRFGGPPVTVGELPSRVAALLVALDLQALDILHVSVPSDPAAFPSGAMRRLLSTCEGLVASGHTQYYGLSSPGFTAVEEEGAEEAGGNGGGDDVVAIPDPPTTHSPDPLDSRRGQPLHRILRHAESLRGVAAAQRAQARAAAAAAGGMWVAGNALGRPDSTAALAVEEAEAAGEPWGGTSPAHSFVAGVRVAGGAVDALPEPNASGHHLVALSYALSPARPMHGLPTVSDGAGGSGGSGAVSAAAAAAASAGGGTSGSGGVPASAGALSVSQLVASYGLTQIVRAPLDLPLHMPASGTLFTPAATAGDASAAPALLPPGTTERVFRMVSAPSHSEWHPTRLMPALNDVLNYAVHLEVMWEGAAAGSAAGGGDAPGAGGVRAEVSAVRAAERERAAARAPVGDAEAPPALPPPVLDASAPPTSPTHPATAALLTTLFAPPLPPGVDETDPATGLRPGDVAWARIIAGSFDRVDNAAEWAALKGRRVLPALGRVGAVTRGVESVREWASAYAMAMGALLGRLDLLMEQAQHHRAAAAEAALVEAVPDLASTPSPAGKLLRLLFSVPGVDAVATEAPEAYGARRKVGDALRAVAAEKAEARRARGAVMEAAEESAAETAAEAARVAARAAEIDALIRTTVRDAELQRAAGGGAGVPGVIEASSGVDLAEQQPPTVAPRPAAAVPPRTPATQDPEEHLEALMAAVAAAAPDADGAPSAASPAPPDKGRCAVDPALFVSPSASLPLRSVRAALAKPALRSALERAASGGLPDWPDPLAGAPRDSELAPLQEAVRRAAASVRRLGR